MILASTRYFESSAIKADLIKTDLINADLMKKSEDPVWLVWLHGLLGDQRDWSAILPFFQNRPCLTIDLPGHGESVHVNVKSLTEMDVLLNQTLAKNHISHYILIGYSLGGRIAMYHACQTQNNGLKGLAIEGGNIGLKTIDDKQSRILHDHLWANKFRQQLMPVVLQEWYKQEIFADLSDKQKDQLISDRKHNDGQQVADMLEATSLGRQPWLGDSLLALQQQPLPICYLCGERDTKFKQIATESQLPLKTIIQAGHNAHFSNPQGFAQQLISFLKEC